MIMATYNKFNQFVEDLAHGVHNLDTAGDTLRVVLLANANAPIAADSVMASLTSPINAAGSNMDVDTLNISASGQIAGDYAVTVDDLTITASGGTVGPFQWIVVYNDTPTSPLDPLVSYYDYGSEITLQDGETFKLDFGATFFTIPAS